MSLNPITMNLEGKQYSVRYNRAQDNVVITERSSQSTIEGLETNDQGGIIRGYDKDTSRTTTHTISRGTDTKVSSCIAWRQFFDLSNSTEHFYFPDDCSNPPEIAESPTPWFGNTNQIEQEAIDILVTLQEQATDDETRAQLGQILAKAQELARWGKIKNESS